MMKTKIYQSELLASVHQIAEDMHDVGLFDTQTMRNFDESCLVPITGFTPDKIRALREREAVSQTVFARYCNITKDYVSKLERGEKKPSGALLKLLSLVERKGLAAIA
jgi:putative transcriptional regulator